MSREYSRGSRMLYSNLDTGGVVVVPSMKHNRGRLFRLCSFCVFFLL